MMRSTLSTPPRAPRLRLTPAPEIVGAPHPFVGTMSTPDLLRRSELPSTEETPGRRDYDASGAYAKARAGCVSLYHGFPFTAKPEYDLVA